MISREIRIERKKFGVYTSFINNNTEKLTNQSVFILYFLDVRVENLDQQECIWSTKSNIKKKWWFVGHFTAYTVDACWAVLC